MLSLLVIWRSSSMVVGEGRFYYFFLGLCLTSWSSSFFVKTTISGDSSSEDSTLAGLASLIFRLPIKLSSSLDSSGSTAGSGIGISRNFDICSSSGAKYYISRAFDELSFSFTVVKASAKVIYLISGIFWTSCLSNASRLGCRGFPSLRLRYFV